MSAPRIVLSGPDWRVVAVPCTDSNGVPDTDYVIELTEAKSKDALGVQQWNKVTGNDRTSWNDWRRVAMAFRDELLRAAGEHREPK